MPGLGRSVGRPASGSGDRPLDTFGRLVLTILALLIAATAADTRGGEVEPRAQAPPAATPTLRATATPTAEPTATPVDLGPPQPDIGRIVEHIQELSVEIGSRVAGSPQEQEAINYTQDLFELWGYEVEVQPFPVASPVGRLRFATLTVDRPEQRELLAASFDGAGTGVAAGPLVDAGDGSQGRFPPEAAGAVVLVERGEVFFADMVRRAQEAGAIGVVIANKEPGRFSAALEPASNLPVVNVDQAEGEALRELLAQAPLEVTLNVRSEVTAFNVIARPRSGPCRTMSGGHIDSVPWAPGANDNASGSAVVLELARATAVAGLSGHCFALFGGEEMGLFGSAFLVSELKEEEQDALVAVFNYDVVAGDAEPTLIGDSELAALAKAVAEGRRIDAEIGSLPEEASSDHASFLEAGIPALMLTTPDYNTIHTTADSIDSLRRAGVEDIAALGFALLQEASRGS